MRTARGRRSVAERVIRDGLVTGRGPAGVSPHSTAQRAAAESAAPKLSVRVTCIRANKLMASSVSNVMAL